MITNLKLSRGTRVPKFDPSPRMHHFVIPCRQGLPETRLGFFNLHCITTCKLADYYETIN